MLGRLDFGEMFLYTNHSAWIRFVIRVFYFKSSFHVRNLILSDLSVELLDMFRMKQTQMYVCPLKNLI